MTTKAALILSLAIFVLSCSKEADLVQLNSNSNYSVQTSKDIYKSTIGDRTDDDSSIVIASTHWLRGEGELLAILEKVNEEAGGALLPSGRYAVTASGDAMSIQFARGFSELSLVYHTGAHRLQGGITTEFTFGETLELMLDGNVSTRYTGEKVSITVNVQNAVFRTKTQVYKLSSGEVKFLLPRNPEGEVNIEISSTIKLDPI